MRLKKTTVLYPPRQLQTNWTVVSDMAPDPNFRHFDSGHDPDYSVAMPYWVDFFARLERRVELQKSVEEWYAQQGCVAVCAMLGGRDRYYFRTAQDQMLFLLRWR